MPIYIGSNKLVRRFIGTQEVLRSYVDGQLVWSRGFQLEGVVAAQQVGTSETTLATITMPAAGAVNIYWTVNWTALLSNQIYALVIRRNGTVIASRGIGNLSGVQSTDISSNNTIVAPGDTITLHASGSASNAANRQIASSPWNIYTP